MSSIKQLQYEKYHDSGVYWIGMLPAHWCVSPLKYNASFSGGGTPSKDVPAYWGGSIPWVSPKDMKVAVIAKTQDYITEEGVLCSSTNMVDEGAVLLVVRSGILQRKIPVALNSVPVALNQDLNRSV